MVGVSAKLLLKTSGKQPKLWFTEVKQDFQNSLEPELKKVKERVLDELRRFINSNRARPSGQYPGPNIDGFKRLAPRENLYNVIAASSEIKADNDKGRYQLGIGNVDFLNKFAPYWKFVNDGGMIGGKTGIGGFMGYFGSGHRPSTTYRSKEMFTRAGMGGKKKMFLMIPQNPITPLRYLSFLKKTFEREIQGYNYGGKYSGVPKSKPKK